MENIKRNLEMPENYSYLVAFPTMKCNFGCSYCLNTFDDNFNRTKFKECGGEDWINGLNRIKSRKGVPITFSGGEPLMHPDFTKIVNGLNPDLEIDILTNLCWQRGLEKFIAEVSPERLKRESKYPPIRASYHPEQTGDGKKLLQNIKIMKDAGFDVGIVSVLYPSPKNLDAVIAMQYQCANEGIFFRAKNFTGTFGELVYGDYSKYPGAAFSEKRENCLCKISQLIIGSNTDVYKCHRDLYKEENPLGNLLDPDFRIKDEFRECNNYGECHPCDVQLKTDYKQEFGHTSVEIIKDQKNGTE